MPARLSCVCVPDAILFESRCHPFLRDAVSCVRTREHYASMQRHQCKYAEDGVIRNPAFAFLAILVSFVAGCGGGGGGVAEVPGPTIDPQPKDVLRAAGLTVTCNSDKDTYLKGETMHVWLSVRNESSRAHTVALHTMGEGYVTWQVGAWGDDPSHAIWRQRHFDTPSWQILPGQTVDITDAQWNQTPDAGTPVETDHYTLSMELSLVWLDGVQASPLPLSVNRWVVVQ